jgi:hypothetical protein
MLGSMRENKISIKKVGNISIKKTINKSLLDKKH